MTKIKKVGRLPVNSRIYIDYRGKKPTIKFKYPRKDAFNQLLFTGPTVFLALALTLFLLGIGFIIYSNNIEYEEYPSNCSATFRYYNYTKGLGLDNLTIACDNNRSYDLRYNGLTEKKKQGVAGLIQNYFLSYNAEKKVFDLYPIYDKYRIYYILTFPLIFIVFIFIFALLFAKVDIFSKKVPILNKKLTDKGYYAKFKEAPSKVIEIPKFSNIYMDYKATKDFSKYLERVEVLEHPFHRIVKKIGRRKRKEKNIYFWYTKFYFSEVPKSGSLEVWFR